MEQFVELGPIFFDSGGPSLLLRSFCLLYIPTPGIVLLVRVQLSSLSIWDLAEWIQSTLSFSCHCMNEVFSFHAFKRRSLQPRVFNNNFVRGSIVVVVGFTDKVKWDVIDLAVIYFLPGISRMSNSYVVCPVVFCFGAF